MIFILVLPFCDAGYESRKEQLIMNGIAVWDVIQSCSRHAHLEQHNLITEQFMAFNTRATFS
jgi:hypothetical protein